MARPKIDKQQFEKLVMLGCRIDCLMWWFRCSLDDIDSFCKKEYQETFSELMEEIEYATHNNTDSECPYSVYMHITPNGKKYIGITKSRFNKRWSKGKGYWSNQYFTNAIKKYGWDNIQHAILFMHLTKEEAEQKEREYIKKYNTTNRKYGYNIESGGSLNKEVSENTREKLRQNATGIHPSDETRRKMSESHKGEKCHFYGTHLTREQKERLRELKSKAVLQYRKDGVFIREYSSMTEAAMKYSVTRQAISSCCNGSSKTCKGYIWRWKE